MVYEILVFKVNADNADKMLLFAIECKAPEPQPTHVGTCSLGTLHYAAQECIYRQVGGLP